MKVLWKKCSICKKENLCVYSGSTRNEWYCEKCCMKDIERRFKLRK